MLPYVVSGVVAVTVMHVLLFVLHVCMLWECEGARVSAMPVWGWGGEVAVSVCMGGTHGSGVLSSAGDVLEMSVVRGVVGVCDMCICLAWGGVCWVRGLGLGFSNPGGTGGKWGMCVCLVAVVWVVLGGGGG